MGASFKLVGEICDKEKKGNPLFLFFATNLIHELNWDGDDFFYIVTKT